MYYVTSFPTKYQGGNPCIVDIKDQEGTACLYGNVIPVDDALYAGAVLYGADGTTTLYCYITPSSTAGMLIAIDSPPS